MQPVEAVALRALLRRDIWESYRGILTRNLFSNKLTRAAFTAINSIHTENEVEEIPLDTVELVLGQHIPCEDARDLCEVLGGQDIPVGVRGIINRHIANQILLGVGEDVCRIVQGAEDVSIEAIIERLQNAAHVQTDTGGVLDYMAIAGVYDDKTLLQNCIPLGLCDSMDQWFKGGIAAGELLSFIAPTAGGKSLLLLNIGAYNMLAGRRVLHVTTEENGPKCANRYDSIIAAKCARGANDIAIAYERGGRLWIRDISEYDVTPGGIESAIRRDLDESPEVIVVDYADELVSSRRYNEKRFELTLIYKELRQVGGRLGIPVITATQANRQALMKDKITLAEVAESFGIVRKADHIIAINYLEPESYMILQVLKSRRRARKPTWEVMVDQDSGNVTGGVDYENICRKVLEQSENTGSGVLGVEGGSV